jgi:predicted amidohydrolase YtcJ
MPDELADVVFRVGRGYGMTADRGIYQAVAVKNGRITAVGRARDELDSLVGPGTAVIDDPELVLYPAFNDTHNHQLLAARDLDYVSLEQARSIDELAAALRGAADRTPAGEWVISSRCWHETHLREGRLPTAQELDAASARHPVFVQRGGHVGVANSAALRLAGTRTCLREPWSSSTRSWPTLPLASGRCGWAWGSPCSIRCCTPWAATWCGTGVRTGPARSCPSGPGLMRGR